MAAPCTIRTFKKQKSCTARLKGADSINVKESACHTEIINTICHTQNPRRLVIITATQHLSNVASHFLPQFLFARIKNRACANKEFSKILASWPKRKAIDNVRNQRRCQGHKLPYGHTRTLAVVLLQLCSHKSRAY